MADTVSLSIVVPAYNEAARLADGIGRLERAIAKGAIDPSDTEIVLVDDGSTDGTSTQARALLAHLPHARVVRAERNRGKGAAIRRGVGEARGRYIAFTDADMAIDPEQFPSLVTALAHAHVAIGSRRLPGATAEGDTARRRVMGRVFNRLVNAATGLGFGDTQCGFKGFRAPVARLLFHSTGIEGFAFDVEVLYAARQLGLLIDQVPVSWHNVGGTRIRPVADPVAMAVDIVSSWAHRRAPTPMPALRWYPGPTREGLDHDLAPLAVTAAGPSFPVLAEADGGATVLLPLASPAELDRVAAALSELVEQHSGSVRQISVSFAALRARAPLDLVPTLQVGDPVPVTETGDRDGRTATGVKPEVLGA
jgi:dolichyl-phosphate beta-glucosyltransferase